MKINHIHNDPIISNPQKDSERKADPKTTQATKSVDIKISNSAKELVNRINQVEDKGYSEKVEKIRAAVLEGTYKVLPEKIANSITKAIEIEKGNINNENSK